MRLIILLATTLSLSAHAYTVTKPNVSEIEDILGKPKNFIVENTVLSLYISTLIVYDKYLHIIGTADAEINEYILQEADCKTYSGWLIVSPLKTYGYARSQYNLPWNAKNIKLQSKSKDQDIVNHVGNYVCGMYDGSTYNSYMTGMDPLFYRFGLMMNKFLPYMK
jgi:hypothetical protein